MNGTKFNMHDYTNDLLKDFARYTSEPFTGIPQKPMATECTNCGHIEVTVICRYCGSQKCES